MSMRLGGMAIAGLLLATQLSGCVSVGQQKAAVQDNSADRMTIGKVRKEIRIGMSGAEVAQVLGSPNIVITDEERREVWRYDKIATERAYSSSSGGVNALILALGGSALGAVRAGTWAASALTTVR